MKSTLAANRFKTHNNKSKELVASKFHSTLRNVRIVINTGIDKNTGNPIKGKAASFKAVAAQRTSRRSPVTSYALMRVGPVGRDATARPTRSGATPLLARTTGRLQIRRRAPRPR